MEHTVCPFKFMAISAAAMPNPRCQRDCALFVNGRCGIAQIANILVSQQHKQQPKESKPPKQSRPPKQK